MSFLRQVCTEASSILVHICQLLLLPVKGPIGVPAPVPLGHYLLDSCFSSENFQDGMRVGGSLPLPIIHILSFYYQNLVK